MGENLFFSTLLGPVLVLWVGALALFALDRLFKPQDGGIAESLTLLISLISLFGARAQLGIPITFSESLSEAGWTGTLPFLVVGETSWMLALVLVGGAWLASLGSLGQPIEGRAGRLATLGAALLFFFAGDWATLTLSWVVTDVLLLYTLTQSRLPSSYRWTGVLSLCGALLLGVSLFLWQQGQPALRVDPRQALASELLLARPPSVPLDVMEAVKDRVSLPRFVPLLSVVAALLRLMPFPLPIWQTVTEMQDENTEYETRPVGRTLLFSLPILLGTYLWMRLAEWRIVSQSGAWPLVLLCLGGMALLATAVRAWTASHPDQLITSVNTYGGALVLLGAGLQLATELQLYTGVHVVLAAVALFISWTHCKRFQLFDPDTYRWVLPTGVGILSLAGLPVLTGFPVRVGLYRVIFASNRWLLLVIVMLGEALTLGALLRVVLDVEATGRTEREEASGARSPGEAVENDGASSEPSVQNRLSLVFQRINYGAALALVLGIAVLGAAPGMLALPGLGYWIALPTVPVWAAFLLPVVGAAASYRSQDAILDYVDTWWPVLRRVLRPGKLLRPVEQGLDYLGSLIWGTTRVVEGAGYMAWVVLVCLVVLLFVLRGR